MLRLFVLLWITLVAKFSVAMEQAGGNPCQRTCLDGDPPMVCYYHFELEEYYTMSKACFDCPRNVSDCYRPHCIAADGVPRAVYVVNRQFPGPSIQVCENDLIVVDVKNKIGAEGTTIHWHGIHQRESPYMDGVPYVSQCDIPANSVFRYQFLASTPGTHYWHSHSALQRADGLSGTIIVRQTLRTDPHINLYDYDLPEHVVHVQDWSTELALARFAHHVHYTNNNKPESMLINGRNMFNRGVDPLNATARGETPPAIFKVKRGYRYRFRFASNAFMNCPFEISVDNHTLLMIATDGAPFEPMEVDKFVIYAGERFDFVLNANESVDNYWIRFQGLLDCDQRFQIVRGAAVLRYEGAPEDQYPEGPTDYFSMGREGRELNPYNSGTVGDRKTVVELNALAQDDETEKPEADVKFYLSYDFYNLSNKRFNDPDHYPMGSVVYPKRMFTPQINHLTLHMPHAPLMAQHQDIDPATFCNHTTRPERCMKEVCSCLYTLNIPLGAVAEIVFVDEGLKYEANHPFHIHGYGFRVVAMDRLGLNTTLDRVKKLDKAGLIKRKLKKAVIKDTVTVPDGGYTVVRFVADNPGYWLLHCHISFHMDMGMALIVKVGEHDMFQPVPDGFPRCGNYVPPISEHFLQLQRNPYYKYQYRTHGGITASPVINRQQQPNFAPSAIRIHSLVILASVFILYFC